MKKLNKQYYQIYIEHYKNEHTKDIIEEDEYTIGTEDTYHNFDNAFDAAFDIAEDLTEIFDGSEIKVVDPEKAEDMYLLYIVKNQTVVSRIGIDYTDYRNATIH